MSEYQYYEFQAIDRPLTGEEQRAVASLSSRVDPHPRQAVFVYNWGDFRGNPRDILLKYYDALLYMASWGSRQLVFRFPRGELDLASVEAYCQPLIVQDYVSLSVEGEYVVLNIEFHDEGGDGWVEGEGWLPAMLGLRDNILAGDYRALYLAWLHVLMVDDLLDSVPEPPVPAGLSTLTPALRKFADFFGIDDMLLKVAAEASGDEPARPQGWLQLALSRLTAAERDAFLQRLAQGEPHLSAALNRRLREIVPLPRAELLPRRTVGQLLEEAEARREREQKRRAQEAEAKRVRDLEAFARREAKTWAEVESLIEQMQARPYDEAVALLVRLRDLAQYRGEEAAFQARINHIHQQYSRRSGLTRRLRDAGLYEL